MIKIIFVKCLCNCMKNEILVQTQTSTSISNTKLWARSWNFDTFWKMPFWVMSRRSHELAYKQLPKMTHFETKISSWIFSAATKQLYEWLCLSVCLSHRFEYVLSIASLRHYRISLSIYIAYFGRISPFPDDNSSAFQYISMKSCSKLCLAILWNPIVF